jgi:muramoyltetrapeptide carboxypeptidase
LGNGLSSLDKVRIGVVAPASRLEPATAERVTALAEAAFGGRAQLVFHPQCFLSAGHFAGDDDARAAAFLEFANDAAFSHLWFARGGYGSGRIASRVLSGLTAAAKGKTYLGYSDGGFLLAALYGRGYSVAHASIPHDVRRTGGDAAVERALAWMTDRARDALEPSIDGRAPVAAFNLTILSKLIGTPWMPDLRGHVLMIEEVSEHLYAIDRLMLHATSNEGIRKIAGIRLGRMSDIPDIDPPFGQTPEQIVRHWCGVSGIPFLGAADIGHDAANKVVPFGMLASR